MESERFSIRDSARSLKKYGSTCNHVRNNTKDTLIRHDVVSGDTLQGIALKYECTVSRPTVTAIICSGQSRPNGNCNQAAAVHYPFSFLSISRVHSCEFALPDGAATTRKSIVRLGQSLLQTPPDGARVQGITVLSRRRQCRLGRPTTTFHA